MTARLKFEERKFILKFYWKCENAVDMQRHYNKLKNYNKHQVKNYLKCVCIYFFGTPCILMNLCHINYYVTTCSSCC